MVKRGLTVRLLICLTLLAAFSAGGCAYTTVVKDELKPELGPRQSTGLSAQMPQVQDKRVWPEETTERTSPNVRIFAEQITDTLRQGLVANGLFSRLADPAKDSSEAAKNRLTLVLNNFALEKDGRNPWLVPHMFVDGLVLPAFAVGVFITQAQVDLGGYWIPSTDLNISLTLSVVYQETVEPLELPARELPQTGSAQTTPSAQTASLNPAKPDSATADQLPKEEKLTILDLSFLVDENVGAFSEKELFGEFDSYDSYGARLSKDIGKKALLRLVEVISRDPHWGYLDEFRTLVLAERKVAAPLPLSDRVLAAETTLGILEPLAYDPAEAQILRNGALETDVRAKVVNGLRANRLKLENASLLPETEKITEEKAEELFNDPELGKVEVQAALAERVFILVRKVLTPIEAPEEEPVAQAEPGTTQVGESGAQESSPIINPKAPLPDPPDALELRNEFISKVAKAVDGKPLLQEILMNQAERAVGTAWAPMKSLLQKIDSSETRQYLEEREPTTQASN
ncbi:hypothetical protein X474_05900 [Dethiosulfatarculus sandiegensis]|uniref:Uncharacterized protein n=1 Tax=Dethiosulfatarculus sandiegensis TaxID=1429043 RepID=A0A0D2JH51_9BACT|nr:hypothetical protein X474_05900 [Dethiosulfatarculus sandiegensis]